MKIQWTAAVVLSVAMTAACGEKPAGNTQNSPDNDGTTVSVPQEPGAAANLQPPPPEQPVVSSNRDGSSRPSNSVGTTSRPRTTEPARPVERLQPEAPRATAAPVPTVRIVTIPVGTVLPLELTTAVSSATAEVETPVSARLRRAVIVDGTTALPAGSIVHGEVSEVDRAGRVQGRSRLALRFTSVVIDGRRESLRTNPVAFEGEATKSEDATKIGAGAGIGAAIGGLLGGGSGAAKGAVIGGAAGTGAVLATRGKDVELASGATLDPTLASAAEVEVR
jgi:hypothetical protein